MPSRIPTNFRHFKLKLNNQEYVIAGMADPITYNSNPKEVLNFLKEYKYSAIISLEEAHARELSALCKHEPITHHVIPVEDFHAPTINDINKIKNIITSSKDPSAPIAIHCRGGNGRTGTILVALCIIDAIQHELSLLSKEELARYDSSLTDSIKTFDGDIPCSKLIAKNTLFIRSLPNSSHSIETKEQVDCLNQLERELLNTLRKKHGLPELGSYSLPQDKEDEGRGRGFFGFLARKAPEKTKTDADDTATATPRASS